MAQVFKSINVDDLDDHLKEVVIAWFAIDDKIKELSAELKEYKDEKKQVEEYIIEYMNKQEEEMIETTNGNIIKQTKESKSGINADLIVEALTKLVNDQAKALEITNQILQNRTTKQVTTIKRQIVRKLRTNARAATISNK